MRWGFSMHGKVYGALALGSIAVCGFSWADPGKVIEKVVTLTFDDGPSPRTTPIVLKTLKKNGVKAVFFVVGQEAKKHPDLLKAIVQDGHILGNHSYDHAVLPKLSAARRKRQLDETDKLIAQFQTGTKFFRPPYGAVNKKLQQDVDGLGAKMMMWSIDPRDWKKPSQKTLISRVSKALHPGAVVLLHDIHKNTANALDGIIKEVRRKGYGFTLPHATIVPGPMEARVSTTAKQKL